MTIESPRNEPAGEPQPQAKPKTLWHRLLGKWLELLLTRLGVEVYTELQVMSEPPKADIVFLRRLSPLWTPAQRRLLPDGVRDNSASRHLIEFKFTESLNRIALQQALAYDFFYRDSQNLKETELQTYVFSSRTPQPAFLQEFGYVVAEHPGVYRSTNPMLQPILVLVLNDLRPAQHNAFVQCFASRGRVRRAAFKRLETIGWEELSEALWDFYVGLQRHLGEKGREGILMAQQEVLTPEVIIETGKRLRKSLLAVLTPEERLAGLAPEDRLAGLAPEDRLAGLAPDELQQLLAENEQARQQAIQHASPSERLAGLAPEERLAGLAPEERLAGLAPEERLAGLKPEELKALLAQIEAYLRRQ